MEDISCWESKFELCSYAVKLLEKIKSLNRQALQKVEINEVKKAIYYARKYHGEQVRDSGEVYYSHPIEVTYMLCGYLFKTDVIIAAILHDVLEDTTMTKEGLNRLFGSRVTEMVSMLSKTKEKSIRNIVNNAFYAKDREVLLIKLFDRIHNLLTLKFQNKARQQKKAYETMEIFLTLALYLNIENVNELIEQICVNIINDEPQEILPQKSSYSSFSNNYDLSFPDSRSNS